MHRETGMSAPASACVFDSSSMDISLWMPRGCISLLYNSLGDPSCGQNVSKWRRAQGFAVAFGTCFLDEGSVNDSFFRHHSSFPTYCLRHHRKKIVFSSLFFSSFYTISTKISTASSQRVESDSSTLIAVPMDCKLSSARSRWHG